MNDTLIFVFESIICIQKKYSYTVVSLCPDFRPCLTACMCLSTTLGSVIELADFQPGEIATMLKGSGVDHQNCWYWEVDDLFLYEYKILFLLKILFKIDYVIS